MRALVCEKYGSPDNLALRELDDPVAGPGEILVDIKAAGLNFPDVLVVSGQYQVKTPPPFIPGHEAAGTVAGVGEGAGRFNVGDKVIITPATGAFAERCAVPEQLAMPVPNGLDFAQAAGFTITYSTSYHALRQHAGLQDGETVLVLGAAGGVGITAVEIAKALGARVIAAASTDDKLEFAKALGAVAAVNAKSTADVAAAVREVTGGGAHPFEYRRVSNHFALALPENASQHPATGTNWQDVGVTPDILVPAEEALDVALRLARKAVAD